MVDLSGFLIVGLLAVGMAASFLAADRHSPTSRALAALFGLLGLVFLMNIAGYEQVFGDSETVLLPFFSLAETGILVAGFEWILRMGRTAATAAAPGRGGEGMLRVAQGLAVVYGLVGAFFPRLRLESWNAPWTFALLQRPEFYAFALPFNLSLILASTRVVQLLRGGVDPAERLRLVALMLATPFWCAGLVLSPARKPLSFAIGEIIFLAGAILYHVQQGQRGQFLSRFVSPQVMHLVRARGLASVMSYTRVELSVLVCDLRGFTAFSERAAPEEIMALLEQYYHAVGEVVTELGGSIKDFAGDGVVVLIGAPIVERDHARRAVAIALGIRQRTGTILAHWNARGLQLGLGIGIASGFVTVGVIGGIQRLEYTAVGPAMNLAARLCAHAQSGQVLVDERVVGSVGAEPDGYRFERIESAALKGFARPVEIFAVASAP